MSLFNATPNQLSIFRIILTPFFAWTFLTDNLHWKLVSAVIFTIAAITDWYDGHVARKYGLTSIWGRFLDPLADKILVLTAFFVCAFAGEIPFWMVWVIVIRDVLVTGLRWYAMFRKHPIRTSYTAKAKTTSQMITLFVLIVYPIVAVYANAGVAWCAEVVRIFESLFIIDILMWIVVLLTVLTGIQYLIENKGHLKTLFWDVFHVFGT